MENGGVAPFHCCKCDKPFKEGDLMVYETVIGKLQALVHAECPDVRYDRAAANLEKTLAFLDQGERCKAQED